MTEKEKAHLRGELAKSFWQTFKYGSPLDPKSMANFVLIWFDLNGYKIGKK